MRMACNNIQAKGGLVVQLGERLLRKQEMDAGFESPQDDKVSSLKILPWWWNGKISLPVYKVIYKCNLPNSVKAKHSDI